MNSFRVLQFNMQFGQSWREFEPDRAPVNLAATIDEIRKQNADIVMLQEVEHAKLGGAQVQPPPNYTKLTAALSEYHGCFAYPKADPRELPFGIGLAILSKQPISAFMRLDLSSPAIGFEFRGKKLTPTDRVLIGAETSVLGRSLQLLNTHLLAFFMLGSTSSAHPEQIASVGQELGKVKGPAILTGDFNVSHHQFLIDSFSGLGFSTAQTEATTWRRRPFVLDHIFYNAPLKCIRSAVVPTPVSDHHMLMADFQFTD